ncbi:MAG: glycosyltransferase family 39 protein [Chloroflexi bacterium]|nr:glycosyltransferase family 39 protein [Chloroflexota bacterium]
MKGGRSGQVVVGLVALWVMAVYAGYYAVHKPLTPGYLPLIASTLQRLDAPWASAAIADTALNFAVALWMAFVAHGIGQVPLRLGRLELTRLERAILATSLGLGILSLITFLLGILGLLYSWVFYAVFSLASAAILAWNWPGAFTQLLTTRSRPSVHIPRDKVTLALALYVALTLILALLAALTPPWAWDGLVYHLTGPAHYLSQRQITGGLDGMHFYFPPLVEMLFLAGMAIKGPVVANLIHWEYIVLAVGAVYCFARRFFGGRVAGLAVAIFLSTPSIVFLSSKPYVDLALVAYVTLSFWCVMAGFRDGGGNWFLLAATFIGFAAGVKYTSVIGVAGVGAVVIVELWRRGRSDGVVKRMARARALGVCVSLAAAVALPWYLKNLALTGNPFYPFLFGGAYWDSFDAAWVSRAGSGLIREPWRLMIAPLEMTTLGVEGGWGYQATIGPLLLALLPLLGLVVFGEKRDDNTLSRCRFRVSVTGSNHEKHEIHEKHEKYVGNEYKQEITVRAGEGRPTPYQAGGDPSLKDHYIWNEAGGTIGACVVFVGVAYGLWLGGVAFSELLQQTRLLFPVFGVLAVIAAYGVCNLRPMGGVDLRRFMGATVGMVLALTFATQLLGFLADSPLQFVVGKESKDEYLSRQLGGYYGIVEWVNQNLGEDARIYFLWEPRSYYFQRTAQPDTILNNWRHLLVQYDDGDAIRAALRSQRYTHVLINIEGLRFVMDESHREVEQEHYEALVEFERRYLRLVYGPRLGEPGSTVEDGVGSYSLSELE